MKPIPRRIQRATERAIVAASERGAPLTATQAAYLREHGRYQPLVLTPWLAAVHARQDAEWALEAAMEVEEDALAAAGIPLNRTDGGIDIDLQETLCRRCPAVVVVRGLPNGACIVTNRDGSLHSHAPRPGSVAFGQEARDQRRQAPNAPRAGGPLGVDPLTL